MTTYTYVAETLLLDGEPVLSVPGASLKDMAVLAAQYQADADAPKVDPDLAAHRHREKVAVESEREKALDAGVEWNGKKWYADTVFQVQLTAYITAFVSGVVKPDHTVMVRATDKTVHNLTFDDLKSLASVLLSHVQSEYVKSWSKKGAVDAKTLPDFEGVGYGKIAKTLPDFEGVGYGKIAK